MAGNHQAVEMRAGSYKGWLKGGLGRLDVLSFGHQPRDDPLRPDHPENVEVFHGSSHNGEEGIVVRIISSCHGSKPRAERDEVVQPESVHAIRGDAAFLRQ